MTKIYDLSMDTGFRIVFPVHRYRNTPQERINLIGFYESALGQIAYSKRGIAIEEPLIESTKSVFRIDSLPVEDMMRYVQLSFCQYYPVKNGVS